MVVSADLKFDDRAFRAALKRFEATSKKSGEQILKEQARLFLKDVILITPPNKDLKQGRKLGEAAVAADIRKIFKGSNAGNATADLATLHQRFRLPSNGRVARGPAHKIKAKGLAAYIKQVQAKVGLLASGWNAAASKLGVKVPDWISRHGTGRGQIKIVIGFAESRITIINGVKFIGNVKDLKRRVQWALDRRAGAMNRQVDNFQAKAARGAGFKT